MGERVLVIDDDPDIRTVIEFTLDLAGFEVLTAPDGESGIRAAVESTPDLVLLDVMMPGIDGTEVCARMRRDGRISHIPIILLTARAQIGDKVEGLAHGADDYITKPFDIDELVARVRAVIRRSRQTGTLSPLTGLPGNLRIEQELARRVEDDEPFALLYADLDSFKAYNDHYGFLRGDEAIRALADELTTRASELTGASTFVGHIGGDDFVAITQPGVAEELAAAVTAGFDERAPDLYDPADAERGFIELEDRQGTTNRIPLLSVSIGIVTTDRRGFEDHREAVEIATEMKGYAKHDGEGSSFAVDRRRPE